MAYRGPLQQDVCMREQAELRRLETGAPGSTELCIECDSAGVNVGIVGGSALPSESGGGAESLLLVQPDAVLANTSDTLVDGTTFWDPSQAGPSQDLFLARIIPENQGVNHTPLRTRSRAHGALRANSLPPGCCGQCSSGQLRAAQGSSGQLS